MNEHGAVKCAAAACDVYAALDLDGLPTRDFVVEKLIGVGIRGGFAHAAVHFDFDSYGGVRGAVTLDIGHDQVGAVFGGGGADIVVGQVRAVLQKQVARESVHLIKVVVSAARQRQFFRRLEDAHFHAHIFGGTHLSAENADDFALRGRAKLRISDE